MFAVKNPKTCLVWNTKQLRADEMEQRGAMTILGDVLHSAPLEDGCGVVVHGSIVAHHSSAGGQHRQSDDDFVALSLYSQVFASAVVPLYCHTLTVN